MKLWGKLENDFRMTISTVILCIHIIRLVLYSLASFNEEKHHRISAEWAMFLLMTFISLLMSKINKGYCILWQKHGDIVCVKPKINLNLHCTRMHALYYHKLHDICSSYWNTFFKERFPAYANIKKPSSLGSITTVGSLFEHFYIQNQLLVY